MAAENIGSLYNTKMPGYEDPADIQAALKLYHYGSDTYDTTNTDPNNIPNPSIAHHLKTLQDGITEIDNRGVGSQYSPTEPSNIVDGFIWVDSSSDPTMTFGKNWNLKTSGSLSGSSFTVSDLNAEKFFIVLKDWSHDDPSQEIKLAITFNNDSGPNYVNTGGLISASALYSPLFTNASTHDLTIEVDLANTASSLKPVSTIADTSIGEYFGYYKNTNLISSVKVELLPTANFDAGSYEVWSYQ